MGYSGIRLKSPQNFTDFPPSSYKQYTFEPHEGSCKIILSWGQYTQTCCLMQKATWLTKGRVLTTVYELRNEIHAFLPEKSPTASLFSDDGPLTLIYLADAFSSVNMVNLKSQGQHENAARNWKHVLAFQNTLKLWL